MKRIVSILLSVTLLMPAFCGCSSSKHYSREVEYIQDSEWFNTCIYSTVAYEGYNGVGLDFSEEPIVYATSDEIIVKESFDRNGASSFKISDYRLEEDGACALVGSIDLVEERLNYRSPSGDFFSKIYNWVYSSGRLFCVVYETTLSSVGDYHSEVYVQELCVGESCLGERIQNDVTNHVFSERNYIRKLWADENGIYAVFETSNETNNTDLKLVSMDTDFESMEEITLHSFDYNSCIDNVYAIGESQVLFTVRNYSDQSIDTYRVDTTAFEITSVDNFPSELNEHNCSNIDNCISYTDITGVYKYNVSENCIDEILSYNNCNVIRSVIDRLSVAYTDDGNVIMYYLDDQNGMHFNIWKFSKADSNPNTGEAIIRIADFDGVFDYKIADAIYRFNETSDSVFIVLDDRYFVDDYLNTNYSNSKEYKLALMQANIQVSNRIRMDIIAGEGPDIILDAFNYNELNNENCLYDLNELLSNLINYDEYLPSVFGYSDKIYQLPLSVLPVCIGWNRNELDTGRNATGISYEEYLSLVDSCANGSDPITMQKAQPDYFIELFNYSSTDFISGGTINIDNDEFRQIAGFVDTRLNPTNTNIDAIEENDYAFFFDGQHFINTIRNFKNMTITALPTADGSTGIKYYCPSSIALASTCPLIDELIPFIQDALDVYSEGIKVSEIQNIAEQYVADINELVESGELPYWSINQYRFNGDEDELYVEVMTASSDIITFDSDISIILYEEMQAYFAGDKTIDDVIPIIEDRIQTVLNERD